MVYYDYMNDIDDFLSDDSQIPSDMSVTPPGGNLSSLSDIKPKDMPRSIMSVYHQLGGDSWLLTQAELYPKEFMSLLKSILPKNINIDMDHEIHISVAPAFSNGALDGRIGVVGKTRELLDG